MSPVQEVKIMEAKLKQLGGADLAVIFPGADGFGYSSRQRVDLTTKGAFTVDDDLKTTTRFMEGATGAVVLNQMIALGLNCFMRSTEVLVVAGEENEADEIVSATLGPMTPSCPLSTLFQIHRRTVVVCSQNCTGPFSLDVMIQFLLREQEMIRIYRNDDPMETGGANPYLEPSRGSPVATRDDVEPLEIVKLRMSMDLTSPRLSTSLWDLEELIQQLTSLAHEAVAEYDSVRAYDPSPIKEFIAGKIGYEWVGTNYVPPTATKGDIEVWLRWRMSALARNLLLEEKEIRKGRPTDLEVMWEKLLDEFNKLTLSSQPRDFDLNSEQHSPVIYRNLSVFYSKDKKINAPYEESGWRPLQEQIPVLGPEGGFIDSVSLKDCEYDPDTKTFQLRDSRRANSKRHHPIAQGGLSGRDHFQTPRRTLSPVLDTRKRNVDIDPFWSSNISTEEAETFKVPPHIPRAIYGWLGRHNRPLGAEEWKRFSTGCRESENPIRIFAPPTTGLDEPTKAYDVERSAGALNRLKKIIREPAKPKHPPGGDGGKDEGGIGQAHGDSGQDEGDGGLDELIKFLKIPKYPTSGDRAAAKRRPHDAARGDRAAAKRRPHDAEWNETFEDIINPQPDAALFKVLEEIIGMKFVESDGEDDRADLFGGRNPMMNSSNQDSSENSSNRDPNENSSNQENSSNPDPSDNSSSHELRENSSNQELRENSSNQEPSENSIQTRAKR